MKSRILNRLKRKSYALAWVVILLVALVFVQLFEAMGPRACAEASHPTTDFCFQTDIFVTKLSPGNLDDWPVAVTIDLRNFVDNNKLSEFGWDVLPMLGSEVPAMIQDIDPGDTASTFWIQGDILGGGNTVTFNVYTGRADFRRDQGIPLHQASGVDALSVPHHADFNITDNLDVIVHADTDEPDQAGILLDKLNGNNGYQLEVTTTGAGSILATVGSGAATDTLEVAWTGDETIRMRFDAGAVNDLDISFLNAAGVWVSQGDTNTTFASLGTNGDDIAIGTGFNGVIQEVEIRDDVGLGSYAKVAQWSFDARDITETQTGAIANGWTYLGTVEDVIGAHDATYSLVNDQSGLLIGINEVANISSSTSSISGIAYTLAALDTLAGLPGAPSAVESWQRGTNLWYVGVVYDTAPFFSILEWNGQNLTLKSAAGIGLVTGAGNAITSWSARTITTSDRIIAIGHDTAPFLTLLRWDDSAQAIVAENTPALAPTASVQDLTSWYDPLLADAVAIAVVNSGDVEFYLYNEKETSLRREGAIGLADTTVITSIPIPQGHRRRTVNTNLTSEDTSLFIAEDEAGIDSLFWYWIESPSGTEQLADNDFTLTDAPATDIIAWNDREGDESEHLVLISFSSGSELRVVRTNHSTGSVISQTTINLSGTSVAVDSWATEVAAGRLIVSAYVGINRLDLLTWNEQQLAVVATLGLADTPTHLTSWSEPRDTVNSAVESRIIAISDSNNSVVILRATVSLGEAIVREEAEDFIVNLADQLGLASTAAAGIIMLLVFIAIYIVEGNIIGSGLVTAGLLIYFLVTGFIAFWVVIPIVFIGLYALYSRYRGAWE